MAASGRKKAATAPAQAQTISPQLLLGVYGGAIFLSAGLLFAVQPLFTKIVLPTLGGSPSVWSVAMVFFQATLLAGYLYAHLLTRHLPGRQSVVVHVLVMLAATLALPLGIAAGWGRPPTQGESLWLIGLFAASIGLPFFALSANAPLLQAWFARTGHPAAGDPYFLYAASNIGSFLALLSYPFVVEPFSRLGQQTTAWSWLFYLLIALIVGCGLLLMRSKNELPPASKTNTLSEAPPSRRDAAIWVALTAIPSAFLIAVTAHISTDVAAVPLLWVIPLALYLLTFVIVFQTKRIIPHSFFVMAQPAVMALLIAILIFDELQQIFLMIGVNLVAFFVSAMVCHGELAQRRPAARHLTEFYLWMSVGGVIGGISAGLIAPHVFNIVAEYPLLIVASMLCRPGLAWPRGDKEWMSIIAVLAIVLAAIGAIRFAGVWPEAVTFNGVIGLVLVLAVVFLARDALRLAGVFACCLLLIYAYKVEGSTVETERSFFGVNKVFETVDGRFRVLMHGTTIHGAQRIRDSAGNPVTGRPVPVTYFSENSPMARAFEAVKRNKKGPIRVAVVGLGAGTVACFVRPEDEMHFFEIDTAVVRIATDPRLFQYISECKRDSKIVVGDARLTLADAQDGFYDLIVMDAFTSDAVPVHLLTREAMALYLRKLAPGGLVVSHVMNRHMELPTVVAGVAAANGLVTRVQYAYDLFNNEEYQFGSSLAAVARTHGDFGALLSLGEWTPVAPDPNQWVWTDDYSNIVGAMIRHMRQ